ncbi:protein-tyrosine phosphatase [Lachnospiraceae bacterium PM6-15]|uniref:protein-tyrosine-phosphatase n=1 Tax=Ohessyouella blattaphilus TaxID=2949333 RepID=A0ABT1EL01_9FIRM|nr:low molecular weight protein-tyrosine-phosphatase [Ohessyouella blattaphilus]MCP1111385.1 low molecular weight phosphotyrosine protein phosphatase [Ohessyouella blattaphilus]MCR8564779.1 low molecular weight phosphotyrosine protein phosphatase [Ohessyouella blattaphilus]
MKKILFICHGNICRSPMAEFVLKDMVKKRGIEQDFSIASAATSREELGSPPHPGTRRILGKLGIDCSGKHARQLTRADYEEYDYLIGMDHYNLRNIERICGVDTEGKVSLLLSFAGEDREIDDPWYTNRFEKTYEDVVAGCEGLLKELGY